MSKGKQTVLSSNLIAIKGSAAPALTEAASAMPDASVKVKEPSANLSPLNFRVTAAFRRKFKTQAAANDLSLIELLYHCFEAWEREQEARG